MDRGGLNFLAGERFDRLAERSTSLPERSTWPAERSSSAPERSTSLPECSTGSAERSTSSAERYNLSPGMFDLVPGTFILFRGTLDLSRGALQLGRGTLQPLSRNAPRSRKDGRRSSPAVSGSRVPVSRRPIQANGSTISTPAFSKSRRFRVTTAIPWTRAVAAIRLSLIGMDRPLARRSARS